MGIDSKVFVVAEYGRALDVGDAVKRRIDQWLFSKVWEEAQLLGFANPAQLIHSDYNLKGDGRLWSMSTDIRANGFDCFQINFTVEGETRTLWYFPDCSCDTDDITKQHTLSFSIGYWGMCDEIMQEVIEALKDFGKVYYDFNDCDDKDYELQN